LPFFYSLALELAWLDAAGFSFSKSD